MEFSIYSGWVSHRREIPVVHQFCYPIFLVLTKLEDETDCRRRWSPKDLFWSQYPSLAWFRRKDHFGPEDRSLHDHVGALVQAAGQSKPETVYLLTNLRYFGFVFNPVSMYFCLDQHGDLQTMVAEVTNTPWNETYSYVIPKENWRSLSQSEPTKQERVQSDRGSNSDSTAGMQKQFHVSPFMPMDQTYDWGLKYDSNHIVVTIDTSNNYDKKNREVGSEFAGNARSSIRRCFNATLSLEKKGSSFWTQLYYLVRFPFLTLQIMLYIYWQAFWLWYKGVPFHSHPAKHDSGEPETVN